MARVRPIPFPIYPLSPNLVIPKPRTSVPEASVKQLEKEGQLIITQKRDGHAALAVISDQVDSVRLYSRGIVDVTDKFPHLVKALEDAKLPAGTILAGEVLVNQNGKDQLDRIQSIMSSKSERSLQLQTEGVQADIAFFNAIAVDNVLKITEPFENRLTSLQELTQRTSQHVGVIESLSFTFTAAKQHSLASDWEGLVLYDSKAHSEIRLDGKFDQTPRPDGCWKWKDLLEDDFVATGFVPSTAESHAGGVKDFHIAQYHPVSGELINCGKVGSGLSRRERYELTNPSCYPLVVQVEFERRFPSMKLRSGRILRVRTNKSPRECLLPITT